MATQLLAKFESKPNYIVRRTQVKKKIIYYLRLFFTICIHILSICPLFKGDKHK